MPERLTPEECDRVLEELGYFCVDQFTYVTSNKVSGPKGFIFLLSAVGSIDAELLRTWLVRYQELDDDDVLRAIRTVVEKR